LGIPRSTHFSRTSVLHSVPPGPPQRVMRISGTNRWNVGPMADPPSPILQIRDASLAPHRCLPHPTTASSVCGGGGGVLDCGWGRTERGPPPAGQGAGAGARGAGAAAGGPAPAPAGAPAAAGAGQADPGAPSPMEGRRVRQWPVHPPKTERMDLPIDLEIDPPTNDLIFL